jgi:hypothetical protein
MSAFFNANDVNIMGRCIHTIKKNMEAIVSRMDYKQMLIKLSTWSCLKIRMQDEVNINIDNKSIERVEQFKYLGTNLMNQNSIQEEIKNRL